MNTVIIQYQGVLEYHGITIIYLFIFFFCLIEADGHKDAFVLYNCIIKQ